MSDKDPTRPAEPEKLVSSVLYTEASAETKKKVVEELKVPDPAPAAAKAALEKFSKD